MQPDQLIALVTAHKWIAVAAILIGAFVRALKQDTPIPITIPVKFRPWLALGLGQVSGVLQAISTGTPWKDALGGGLVSSVLAILGHDLVIESMRGGKEIGAPKLPPPPTLLMTIVAMIIIVWSLAIVGLGCSPAQAQSPGRDSARATVMLIAEGAKAADGICAGVAETKHDATLAKTCADSYDIVRQSLIGAQAFVDSWESADQGSYLCTIAHGVAALAQMAGAIKSAGGPPLPPLVTDAITLGSSFTRGCTS